MFRWTSVGWSLFLWILVFIYSWFEVEDYKVQWKLLPVITWTISAVILITLLAKDMANQKSIILALSWSIIVSIGLILYNVKVIDSIALNIHVTIMSGIVALLWCITSHTAHMTEAGLHWYIWFMLLILTLCCTFNSNQTQGQTIYIVAAGIVCVLHGVYIWHVFRVQSPGQERCQHIFRIISCFILTIILLVSAILDKTDNITKKHLQETIMVVEVIALLIILTDSIIGFSRDPINDGYNNVNQNVV